MTLSTSKLQDIVTEIREQINQSGESGILLLRVQDARMLPLFHAAILRLKSDFFQKDVFPAIEIVSPDSKAAAYLAPCCIALSEAIELLSEGNADQGEFWKKQLFDKAKLVIQNSDPEIVAVMLSKIFSEDIAESIF